MRGINIYSVPRPTRAYSEGENIFSSIKTQIGKKYEFNCVPGTYAFAAIYSVLEEKLFQYRVLDLGCGSRVPINENYSRMFEPWMCRVMHKLGIDVVGVDIRPQQDEEFEHYVADLFSENSMPFIGNDTIDAIVATNLYFDPLFKAGVSYSGMHALMGEAERVCRPEGLFFVNDQRILEAIE